METTTRTYHQQRLIQQSERLSEIICQLPRATPESREVVYLIQAVGGGPVKIGHSTYRGVDRRIQQIQTGNPEQLVVRALFDGGLWLEQALHEHFAELRLTGEWFALDQRLRELCPELV